MSLDRISADSGADPFLARLAIKAPSPILAAEADSGTVVAVNEAATELFGRDRSSLVGMHQTELHPPEAEQNVREGFQAVRDAGRERASGEAAEPVTILRADGSTDVSVRAGGRVVTRSEPLDAFGTEQAVRFHDDDDQQEDQRQDLAEPGAEVDDLQDYAGIIELQLEFENPPFCRGVGVADDIGAGFIDNKFEIVGQLVFPALQAGMTRKHGLGEVPNGRQIQEIGLDFYTDVRVV